MLRLNAVSCGLLCCLAAGCEAPRASATSAIAAPRVAVVDAGAAAPIEDASATIVIADAAAAIEDASATVPAVDDEDEPLTLSLDESGDGPRCAMRVERGQLRADCDRGALDCAEAARGRVSREGEDDVVWLCAASANAEIFVVLATDREALWGQNAMGAGDGRMCADYEASVSLVTVASLSTRALLVKARGCAEPGRSVDRDFLWLWRGGVMRDVASTEFGCTYLDTRIGPSTGLRGQHSCEGTYIEATPSGFNKVGRGVAVRQRGLGAGRLMLGRGHVQARFAWSEALARLGE